jgi:glycosyltransferase involved in cell wall biosynthesis
MKITHIITRLIIGGAQENTLLSCEGQRRLGHDVTLISGPALGPEGSLMERAAAGGYRFVVLDEMRRAIRPWRDHRVRGQLIHMLRETSPEIVHTHSSKAGILGREAAHIAGVPVIIHTIHGLAFTASSHALVNWGYKILERRAAPMSTRIVCVADAMREQSLAAGIGRREQYVTIYSGMETGPFLNPPVSRQEIRLQLGISDGQIVVGTIARLFDLKGHEDLLDIAPELCKQFPELRFLWVGDGLLRQKFENRMLAMNLRDRFVLTGMVPPAQVPELIGAMDLLAHPSRREGLARAIPQAALGSKPGIAYDIDGNREAMQPGVTGILIPPFDRSALHRAIVDLTGNTELRQKMGHAARDFAMKRFDGQVMVDGLEKLYASLITPRPA